MLTFIERMLPASVLACLIVVGSSGIASGQAPIPQIDPSESGLEIPLGAPVRQGEGRTALVADKGGDQVVAQVLVDIGDRRLVILPNGRMASLPMEQAKPTSVAFKPAAMDKMSADMLAVFKGFKTRRTNRFLYIYNTSEGFYTATSRILETMFPGVLAYFERQKMDVHEPEMPLVVIMFKTEKEFQQYQAMPEGVAAYYSQVTNHVVLYEQSDLVDLAPELAVKQSISTIAHEGVHQILFNIGVQKRMTRWPMWISEGLPEYFSPTSTDRRMRWKGVGQINDMRMYELSEYLKRRPTDSADGDLVRRAIEPAGFGSLEYAISWGLVHYLATRQKAAFLAYMADVSKTQPFEDTNLTSTEGAKVHADLFAKHFGDDFAKIEQGLLKHLKSLPYSDPIENQTHFVVMFIIDRGVSTSRMTGVTTSPAGVKKLQEETYASLPAELQTKIRTQVQTFPSRALAQRFAEQWVNGK